MKALAVALFLLASPVVADECESTAKRLADSAGATITTRIGPAFKMAHPEADNLQVDCEANRVSRVSGSRDNPDSVAPFFLALAGVAAEALQTTDTATSDVMLACSRKASARASALAETSAPRLKASCYVQGTYTTIEVKLDRR